MSSPVMTVTAAAAADTGSLRRETEVTSISISSSMLNRFSSERWIWGSSCLAAAGTGRNGRTPRSAAVHRAVILTLHEK